MEEVRLPGGLGAERLRTVRFRPITGALEMSLAESQTSNDSTPASVTAVLEAAVDRIGENNVTRQMIESLCVEDRQFLMRCMAIRTGTDRLWLSHVCTGCNERFDIEIVQSQLPVTEANDAFPEVWVETSVGPCLFRAATGGDQHRLVQSAHLQKPEIELLKLCFLKARGSENGQRPNFNHSDIEAIELALDKITPGIVTEVHTQCPECATENAVAVDPYIFLQQAGDDIYREIHQLAWYYHWSEAEIMAMPDKRRKRYLQLIDQARGLNS